MKTMLIREHRGGLLESKKTEKEIPQTKEAILEYVEDSGMIMTMVPLTGEEIVVTHYFEDEGDVQVYLVKVFSMVFGFITVTGKLELN